MKHKLLYTKNIGFNMRDWKKESIVKVFGGNDCILAVTSDGRTLQKTKEPDLAVRTEYWTRIKDISLSSWMRCHAIGLVSDGTCLVAKRALRYLCELYKEQHDSIPFDIVNSEVKSWKDIVQTAVSDSYFALDKYGRVHVASASRNNQNEYASVSEWRNVKRIVTGPQNSVFGITRDGRILCAGENLIHGPHGSGYPSELAKLSGVYDLCAMGSECEDILIAMKDGTLLNYRGEILPVTALPESDAKGDKVLRNNISYEPIILDKNRRLVRLCGDSVSEVFENCPPIASFAVSDMSDDGMVVLAVTYECA